MIECLQKYTDVNDPLIGSILRAVNNIQWGQDGFSNGGTEYNTADRKGDFFTISIREGAGFVSRSFKSKRLISNAGDWTINEYAC